MRAGTVWVAVEKLSVGAVEYLLGLNGFERRDPGKVVIDFGMARATARSSKGTVEMVVISRRGS